jgi:DNA helicase HerA-like ATPase
MEIIGRVKAPGLKPHTFSLIAPDSEQDLRLGEFIRYLSDEQVVYARITERKPLRLFPNGFSGDPALDPNDVAEAVGYSGRHNELFELTAEIIGAYQPELSTFFNPRVSPPVGTAIYMVENDALSNILNRVQPDKTGAATIGWLASREINAVPIILDVNAIASTHLAIIASTGAGKSYTASVLIEEMLRPQNRAAVLVIDPHGEYDTLADIANQRELQTAGYVPRALIKKPGAIKIRVGSLTLGDLRYLLPNVSERMEYVLQRAFHQAERASLERTGKKYTDRWTLAELLASVKAVGETSETGDEDDRYKGTTEALEWRIRSILKTGDEHVFDDQAQTRLIDLLRPGQCMVMQLNQVDPREQQVIVATLLRRLYQARLKTKREQVDKDDEYYLPYPVFVIMEEAHNFAPAGANIVSTGILKQILAEGRKFGVGVGLISQRPGKLDPDVLSQCNTQILMRIVNPVDQARVAESVESIGRDLLDELPSLNKGQAILSGVAANLPIICQIRKRYTRHGGESANASQEWISAWTRLQDQEARNNALPFNRRVSDGLTKT